MLSAHRVNLVFDIGANVGQFGRSLRDAGYRGRIVSFEPLSVAWEKLVVASRSDSLWEVAPRAAIGNEDGEVEMHVSGNSVSSSVLDMLDAHAIAAPGSAYVGREKVPLRRLDTVAVDYLRPDSLLVIKIDTQGYEDRVLRGASNLLKNTVGLRLECSLVPLYDGQLLYDEMIGRLKELGFALWRMTPEFVDPASGRLLQIEATFFR
jgi:FkbM family methyltransferase